MTIMLREGQKAASKEGKNVRKIQSNCHMITVERSANGNRRNYFQHTLFPKPYPLIRTNPARPYNKTTGHFHSDSLTFKMTEQKENERICIQRKVCQNAHLLFLCTKKVCQNASLLSFTHKAPTFTSWGFVIT